MLYVSVNSYTLTSLQNAPHSYRFILCWLANNATNKTNFSEWKKGTNSIYTLWSNIIHTHISAFFMCSALDRAMNIFFCLLKLCLKWCFYCCSAVGEPIVIFFSFFSIFRCAIEWIRTRIVLNVTQAQPIDIFVEIHVVSYDLVETKKSEKSKIMRWNQMPTMSQQQRHSYFLTTKLLVFVINLCIVVYCLLLNPIENRFQANRRNGK